VRSPPSLFGRFNDLSDVLPKFRQMARGGRDPSLIEITLFGLAEDADRLKRIAETGVTRGVPMFPPQKANTVLPIIDMDQDHATG
jgi:hypothetical protein